MVISSKHRDLLEQLKAADEAAGAAVKALSDYIALPNMDMKVAAQLSQQMEDAHIKVSQIHQQLQAVRIDK